MAQIDRKTQQIIEKNGRLYQLGHVFNLTAFGLNMLNFDKLLFWPIPIISFIVALGALIYLKKTKGKDIWGMYVCLYVMLFIFVTEFWCTDNYLMYALSLPVMILVIMVMDVTMGIRGTIAASGVMIIYIIIHIIRTGFVDVRSLLTQTVVFALAAASSIVAIKVMDKQNIENITELQNSAKKQLDTSGRIVSASEDIANQIDSAKNIVEKLTASISDNDASITGISLDMKKTAEAIERQSQKTLAIHDNIMSASDRSEHMSQVAREALDAVAEGSKLVESLSEQARQSAEVNAETRKATEELNQRIKEVENIIDTIYSISEETTLLALNASIEAARAGEAGKGFAVVADQIRKLSEDTKDSTEQITEIIQKFTLNIEKTSTNIQHSVESAEKQHEMIKTTSDRFDDIEEKVGLLSDDVTGITEEVRDIVDANNDVMMSVDYLTKTSQSVAESSDNSMVIARESKASMDEMNDVLVGIFNVSNDMAGIVDSTTGDNGIDESFLIEPRDFSKPAQ